MGADGSSTERWTLEADARRQATAAIRGFVYQAWCAVKAWLELRPGQMLYLEGAEDFDVKGPEGATSVQVKDTAANITLRSQAVVAAIVHFWDLTAKHPGKDIRFMYLTRAAVGMEQGDAFRPGPPGLQRWRDCHRGALENVGAIAGFLLGLVDSHGQHSIGGALRAFLASASHEEVFGRLIDRMAWLTEAQSRADIEAEVDGLLVEHATRHGVPAKDSLRVASRLFREVQDVSTRERNRELSLARFVRLFDDETKITVHPALLCGTLPSELANLVTQRARVAACNAVVLQAEYAIGGGIELPRAEVDRVLGLCGASGNKRGALVTGEAGAGKSAVLHQLARRLEASGTPFLYFRLDRREPVERPQELGRQLFGIDESPVEILMAVAAGRPAVLIIDQLDAVSEASGRSPWFFDCVRRILAEATATPTMGLALACRKFDLQHDYRLRRLAGPEGIAEEVQVGRLGDGQMMDVLLRLGVEPKRLSASQTQLLKLPLHLALFAEASVDAPGHVAYQFQSAKHLYDRYWEKKERQARERLGPRPSQWVEVIDAVTQQMSAAQQLSVPRTCLDAFTPTARAMESEHVLVGDGSRVGFFHEGFFDYAYARRFAATGGDILAVLREAEQHLFRRAQVRQVLLHRRDEDRVAYVALLRRLLLAPDVRYHIKRVVIALVGCLDDPTSEEWAVLNDASSSVSEPLRRDILLAVWNSPNWLSYLAGIGYLRACIEGTDGFLRDWTVRALCQHAQHLPEVAADLIEPCLDLSDEWNKLLWGHLRFIEAMSCRRLFNMFLALTVRGLGDGSGGKDFWHGIWQLPDSNPEWAAEAIGKYLCRRSLGSVAESDSMWQFLDEDSLSHQVIQRTATATPKAFVRWVLPVFLDVLRRFPAPVPDGKSDLPRSHFWTWRSYRDGNPVSADDAILGGLEQALSSIAAAEPASFSEYEQQLRSSDFEPANYLLVRAYTSGAECFADRALDYLCERPARLHCGWASTGGGNGAYWAAHELIAAILPHCDRRRLRKLRRVLLSFETAYEQTDEGSDYRGFPQFVLLSALAPDGLDGPTRARLGEIRERLGLTAPEPPRPSGIREVVSPVAPEHAAGMTDGEWLAALAQYRDDDSADWDRSEGDTVKGGARQLAVVLGAETKANPHRFCQLVLRLPLETNTSYLDHVLIALRDSSVGSEDAWAVVRFCHALPGRPCGRWIGDPVAKFADEGIPEDILRIIAWYADNDPDPTDELWRAGPGRETVYYGGSLLDAAINSVRGHIAGAIRRLTWAKPDRFSFFRTQVESLVTDRVAAVRAEAAGILIGVLPYDRDRAVQLFLRLCDTDEDRLLETHYVEQFLVYASSTHYESTRQVLQRMVRSPFAKVRQAGARLNALAHFDNPQAAGLVAECLSSGDASLRKGCAEVAAANLKHEQCRDFCLQALPALFRDRDQDIRNEAASALRDLDGDMLGQAVPLVQAFLDSPAFAGNTDSLVWALDKATSRLPDLTFDVCERLLSLAQQQEPQSRAWHDTGTVAKLLFRIYQQSGSDETQRRCLDLIDDMLRAGTWGVSEQLGEFDR